MNGTLFTERQSTDPMDLRAAVDTLTRLPWASGELTRLEARIVCWAMGVCQARCMVSMDTYHRRRDELREHRA